METETVPQKSPQALSKSMDSGSMLLNITDGNYYTLNEVGYYLWEQIDGKKSIDQLAQKVEKHFAVSYDTALKDTFFFVRQLSKLQLILV